SGWQPYVALLRGAIGPKLVGGRVGGHPAAQGALVPVRIQAGAAQLARQHRAHGDGAVRRWNEFVAALPARATTSTSAGAAGRGGASASGTRGRRRSATGGRGRARGAGAGGRARGFRGGGGAARR